MKKLILVALSITALLTIFPNEQLHAQCFEDSSGNLVDPSGQPCVNTIVTAVPFLRIVADARSGAMGDVGIAISADPNALQHNAAKLAFVDTKVAVSATYTPWLRALGLSDVYLADITAYNQLDDLQTIGFGLKYFSLGQINFTDENGQPIGNGNPNEFEIAAAYARKLNDNFSSSLTMKFIYSNLAAGQNVNGEDIKAATALAADLGFLYTMDSGSDNEFRVGLALTNIGSKVSYTESINKDFLPTNFGLGFAYELNPNESNQLTFAFDVNKLMVPTPDPNDASYRDKSAIAGIFSSFGDAPGGFSEEIRELMYSVGVEYWYDQQFAVRAGYYTEHATKGNRKYFTAGLGIKYNVFGLNFSYLVPTSNQRNPLDNTLRFSLMFDFDS
ncbi:MAG: type IX secretion system outer membrane channel protein PorV [Bacteroidia bacterium]|nr:type IX secretion system outer membrane channel protein PorV [Bacteroidia bacterium]